MLARKESINHSNEFDICVGVITAANGVRGNVRVRYFTDTPMDLETLNVFDSKTRTPMKLKVVSHKKDFLIAKIEGVNNRDQAQMLHNTQLCIIRSELPPTQQNEYYHSDLIGLKVFDSNGVEIGDIISVCNFGAGDVLDIHRVNSNQTFMIPFASAFVKDVNIAEGFVEINLPQEEVV